MNIILTLLTTINSKITIGKYNFFIMQGERRKLLVSFNENFFIQVFPVDTQNSLSPYIIMLTYSNGKLSSSSDQIEIIKNANLNFTLLITPKNQIARPNHSQILNIPQNSANNTENKDTTNFLILSGSFLTICKKNEPPLYFNLKHSINQPNLKLQNECYIISSKKQLLKQLVIINPKSNKLKSFNCNHFRIENDKITIVTELKDYAKHIKIIELALDDNLSILDTFFALTSTPKIIKNTKIIPYAFLQNIKAKDFNEARKYLNTDFATQLSNDALTAFFGKFCLILTPQIKSPPLTTCLTYRVCSNYFIARYYNFKFDNANKIINIEEIVPPFKNLF